MRKVRLTHRPDQVVELSEAEYLDAKRQGRVVVPSDPRQQVNQQSKEKDK